MTLNTVRSPTRPTSMRSMRPVMWIFSPPMSSANTLSVERGSSGLSSPGRRGPKRSSKWAGRGGSSNSDHAAVVFFVLRQVSAGPFFDLAAIELEEGRVDAGAGHGVDGRL